MSGNTGHGHVYPRPDGLKARCGGPGICTECTRDAGQYGVSAAVTEPPRVTLVPTLRRYQWRYGVSFTRNLTTGDVTLTVPAHDLIEEKSWTIPAAEWVSMVTEMSGSPTSYPAHYALHQPPAEEQAALDLEEAELRRIHAY